MVFQEQMIEEDIIEETTANLSEVRGDSKCGFFVQESKLKYANVKTSFIQSLNMSRLGSEADY
jgi:hypothetical protein